MAKTAQLALPLLAPAQAQKHVTVNEALVRLDAAAQLRVVSSSVLAPPASAADGAAYLVPAVATGEWQSRAGQVAVRCNGGWIYLLPKMGWRAWNEASQSSLAFDGIDWVADALAISAGGAASRFRIIEFDHLVSAGASNLSTVQIPASAQVLGVTGRVISTVTGVAGWRAGVTGATNRYGAGLGTSVNSYLLGMSGSPVTYYEDTPLLLTAEGGQFSGGVIRLALHLVELVPPRAA